MRRPKSIESLSTMEEEMNRSTIRIFVSGGSSPSTLTAPIGYEFTGEYRHPRAGEWYYETQDTEETKVRFAGRAYYDYVVAPATRY